MRPLTSLLVALAALTMAPLAGAAPLPAPTVVLPWGDLPGEPGLFPGAEERPPIGPIAIAADDARVVISDPANRQLLVLAPDGRVTDTWPMDFTAVDLALLPDGAVIALDAVGDRVVRRDPDGAWRPLPLPAGVAPATLAVGRDGDPWIVDTLGRGHALTGAAAATPSDRATPLGPATPIHAAGRRVDSRHGEVLLWSWGTPASVRAPGPAATLPVTSGDRLLGTVRPIALDNGGGLYVIVESLAPGPTLAVRVEVRRFDLRTKRQTDATAWDVADVAPINHPVAVTPSGALVLMAALPEGLAVWHLGGAR